MNQVIQSLFERKSVRVFTDEPVTGEEKALLLECAFQAPTAGCQQLYTIIDVTDPGEKKELAELCDHQPFIASAPVGGGDKTPQTRPGGRSAGHVRRPYCRSECDGSGPGTGFGELLYWGYFRK